MNIQREERSDEKESPSKNLSITPQEEMTDQQEEVDETIPKQKSSSKKQAEEPQRYEELKIKEGPLYNWTKTKESTGYDNDALSIADDSVLSEDDSNVSLSSSPLYCRPSPLPAESTALLIVDVQPEYWSDCPAVRKDFPDFPKHLQRPLRLVASEGPKSFGSAPITITNILLG